ncbi:MAG: hypothetical protein AAGC95_13110 [Pseudomonadota bacterium]
MITAHQGFDHLYTKVADIRAACAALGDMGFSTTSLDEQKAYSMGLVSVVFQDAWLAFSGPIGPDVPGDLDGVANDAARLNALPAPIAEQLTGLGPQPILIFAASDLKAFVSECASAGLNPSKPEVYPRPTMTETGPAEIRFEMTGTEPLIADAEAMLEIVGLKHLTPDIFFRPALLAHENGAKSIDAVTLPVQQSDELSERLMQLIPSSQAASATPPGWRLGDVTVGLDMARSGVEIAVQDINRMRVLLSARGVNFTQQGGALVVQDHRLAGLSIQFKELNETPAL